MVTEKWMQEMLTRLGKPPARPIREYDDWIPHAQVLIETIIERLEALEKLHASE